MSNESFSRMHRVNSTLKEIIADEIERMNDPRLRTVTVTAVRTAPDLRQADVYFSVFEQEDVSDAQDALTGAAPRLRKRAGDQIRMKYTPSLVFKLDHGIVDGERIDRLLADLDGPDTDAIDTDE